MASKKNNIYTKIIDSEKIKIPFNKLSNNIFEILQNILKERLEKKCNKNGYVKSNSVKLISHSVGELVAENIIFQVSYECYISNPPEDLVIECVVSSITKVGIRALLKNDSEEDSPFVIFVARDHHYNNKDFSKILVNDIINIKVLGKRFELYDNNISIIGELI
jgi:DNA-directed RNA polymerase subunit E'/Rpb7